MTHGVRPMGDRRPTTRWMAAAFALVLAPWAAAQQAAAPEVVWTPMAHDLPEQVSPGYTLFTLDATGEAGETLTIFRLHEGVTVEEFAEVSARIDMAFAEGGDVAAAINEGLALVDVLAEVGAESGERRSVGVVLDEGSYVLEHSLNAEAGPPVRSHHEFRAEGEPGAEPPTADVTVQFVDFAFAFPPGLAAGEQTWHVINRGQQLHHMVIFRLAEGATLDDFMEWMEQMEGPGGEEAPPPDDEPTAEPANYVGIMSSGEESYHVLELEEGDYVAVCFLPDHAGEATGRPHFMLGMIQAFSVGD